MKVYTEDFYAALGVTADATSEEIRTAYRAAALKYHPDKNPDQSAQAKFLLIQEGYEVLEDPVTKEEYDRQYKRNIRPPAAPKPAPQPEQRTRPTEYTRPTRPPPSAWARPEPREWTSWPPCEFGDAFDSTSTPSTNFRRAASAFSNGRWWEQLRNRERPYNTNQNNAPGQSVPNENNFDPSNLNSTFGQGSEDAPRPSQPTQRTQSSFPAQWNVRQAPASKPSRFFPR